MTRYIIDAYAWIEYLEGSKKGEKAEEIIVNNSNEIFTASTTIAEVVSKLLRNNKDINIAIEAINNLSIKINLTPEISSLAGQLHFEAKKSNQNFGMLDAFVVATAKKLNAKILTGDEDFRPFKETIFI